MAWIELEVDANRRWTADRSSTPPDSSPGGVALRAAPAAPNPPRSLVGSDTALEPGLDSSPAADRDRRGPRSARPGDWLGPYRLVERLGRGRQADVWRALRATPPIQEVALKVLPACASARDPRRRAQLRHEAERGVRMTDPALLPTFDFGEARGLLYLAMPLVIGSALGEVLDDRRRFESGQPLARGAHPLASLPEPGYLRAVGLLIARVARALAAAHASRVAHRDIKPMNILLRRDLDPRTAFVPTPGASRADRGPSAGVYLCDFGLARDLDIATPTQLRDGAGSPLYMAPERLLRRPADEYRADIYALGVTLFEALTLEPPVEVPDELPSPQWAAYLAAVEPRPASRLRPEIPERVEDVIHRAMARDPARRHASAAHFAADLEAAAQTAGG